MQIIDEHSIPKEAVLKGNEGNILDDILLWEKCNVPSPSSILVRREVYKTAGGFDPHLSTAADQDFFLRVAGKFKIGRIQLVLGYYREHNHNMHKNVALMEKDHIYVYKKAEKNNYFKSFFFKQLCFSNLYLILAGSWWKNGNNKLRAVYFLIKSFTVYPPNFYKILAKVF
jgi:GT2 family glycosyltransferase